MTSVLAPNLDASRLREARARLGGVQPKDSDHYQLRAKVSSSLGSGTAEYSGMAGR
jgi:hypothetical protein